MTTYNVITNNLDSLFLSYAGRDIISVSSIRTLSEEDLMKSIIDKVHKYHISHGSDGRWSTYVPDQTRPDGRRRVQKKSKTDLYAFLLAYYDLDNDSETITFEDLFKRWKEFKKGFVDSPNKKYSMSVSTIRRYERDYDTYLKETRLAKTFLSKISKTMLEEEIIHIIRDNDMNERCASNIIGYIANAFEYAVDSNLIDNSPASGLHGEKKRKLLSLCRYAVPKDDSDRVLSISEFHALFNSVEAAQKAHPAYMPNYAIELAMLTGMRVGELSALHWNDIDDDFIHINYSEHRLDYSNRTMEYAIGEPKNGKHRVIQITDQIKTLLEKVKAIGFTSDEDFIFCRKDGSRYTGHDISCATARRAKEAGIENSSIHEIRRTVSSMLNTVLPQKAVADMLGHSERVNESHYNYSMAENAEKKAALEQVFSKVLKFEDYSDTKKKAGNA